MANLNKDGFLGVIQFILDKHNILTRSNNHLTQRLRVDHKFWIILRTPKNLTSDYGVNL